MKKKIAYMRIDYYIKTISTAVTIDCEKDFNDTIHI